MNYCWILDSENEEELDSGNWILKPHKIFGLDSGFWILKLSERTGKKLLEARPWILDEMVYAEPRTELNASEMIFATKNCNVTG